jgi:outer membrane protein
MKKFIFIFCLVAAAFNTQAQMPAEPVQGPLKVGYTNIEIVLSYMPEAVAVEKEIKIFVDKRTEFIEIKYRYLESLTNSFMEKEESKSWPTPEVRAADEKQIRALQAEIQKTEQDSEQELMEKRFTMLQPVQNKIQMAINDVAKEGGYSYILNQTMGSGIPSIIFGLEQFDVTDAIAAKLGITIPKADPKQ